MLGLVSKTARCVRTNKIPRHIKTCEVTRQTNIYGADLALRAVESEIDDSDWGTYELNTMRNTYLDGISAS